MTEGNNIFITELVRSQPESNRKFEYRNVCLNEMSFQLRSVC